MAKLLVDMKESTKAKIVQAAESKGMTIKAYVLAALRLKDE